MASAVAVLTLGSMSLLCWSSNGSLLEVPRIQFIARVGRHSSMHRDRGLSFGGDVGLGFFRAPPGRPGVERQFSGPWALANSSSDVVAMDISLFALTTTTTTTIIQ